jgi:hypothetical protein
LVTPHVAAKDKHSAVDGRIKRHEGYKTSLKVRKRIEEALGWIKTVGGLAKTKLMGRASFVNHGIRAPETGKTACKQAEMALAIVS